MTTPININEQILELFRTDLQLTVPSPETDLLEAGLLDSMVFVELIMHLEQRLKIQVDLEDLDLDRFRTIKQIAAFAAEQLQPGARSSVGVSG